jgi:outer membrane protein/protease secretion system outer membrane protein
MRAPLLRAVAAAALACAAASAWSLDLSEAYRLAYDRDATVRASRAASEAGREKLPQARAQFFPNISASASRFRNDLNQTQPNFLGQATSTESFYYSENETIQLRQPIYRKALTANYRQAEALVAAANASQEKDEQLLVMRVTQAYFESLQAEEQLRLLELTKAAYAAQVDAATKAFKGGIGTRTDIDDAQARYDLSVSQELEAKQAIEINRRKLQVIIGQPPGKLAPMDISKLVLTGPLPDNIDAWTALAEDASPEMLNAKAQVAAAREEIEKARAGHYPTLDAVAQASRSSSENVTNVNSRYIQKQIGLQLQVPIFNGGYVNSQEREALANLEQAEAKLDELKRDLGVRVHTEFQGMDDGVLKVKALEQAVKSAEQLVVSSRRSFEAGVRTRIDILNAEQQAGQARRDLSQARLAYMLSRVRLKALTGGLKAENVDEMNAWLQH